MRKTSILGNIAKNAQRNATINATKATYIAVWGETPKKRKRKTDK